MTRGRLALILAALPLAFQIYACSSDDSSTPSKPDTDGGNLPDTGTTPPGDDDDTKPDSGGTDSGGDDDSGPKDGGTDADAALNTDCVGSPLSDDGGFPDGGVTLDASVSKEIATGSFPDGPVYVDDSGGQLVFSEVFNQYVDKVQGDGGGAVVQIRDNLFDGGSLPTGNSFKDGIIYTAQNGTLATRAVTRSELDGGKLTNLAVGDAGYPNDIVVSAKNMIYFSDPGYNDGSGTPSTGLFQMQTDGGAFKPIIRYPGGASPGDRVDGLALAPNQNALWVGVFDAQVVRKFAIDANGNVASTSTDVITTAQNPTGIAIDATGNVWVAEDNGDSNVNGIVEVFSSAGRKYGQIPFTNSRPTGIAFGGADNKNVYVTAERGDNPGSVYMFKIVNSKCIGKH